MFTALKNIIANATFRILHTRTYRMAERGAAILDRVTPDWFTKVDLNRLDIGNGKDCVLAQVYADQAKADPEFAVDHYSVFGWAVWDSNLGFDDLEEPLSHYGFACDYEWGSETWNDEELRRAWTILIIKRLKTA